MNEIGLRRLKKGDEEQIAKLANNKKIWDNLRDLMPHPYHLKDAESFIELTEKEMPHHTFGIQVNSNELCGVIGLVLQSDIYRGTAEIGYWIGEEFWGKGIATKAVELMTQYGFEELKLERIYSGVFAFNKASMRVLEKNGYKQEGIFRNAAVKNGNICDEHRFARLKR